MAMFPSLFWETFTNEIGRYAAFKIKNRQEEGKVKRPKLIASHKWFPVELPEVMMFFGLLLYFCCTHRLESGYVMHGIHHTVMHGQSL
jgi:hypothetical protein